MKNIKRANGGIIPPPKFETRNSTIFIRKQQKIVVYIPNFIEKGVELEKLREKLNPLMKWKKDKRGEHHGTELGMWAEQGNR